MASMSESKQCKSSKKRSLEPELESVGLDAVQVVAEEALIAHESELLVEAKGGRVGHLGLEHDLEKRR